MVRNKNQKRAAGSVKAPRFQESRAEPGLEPKFFWWKRGLKKWTNLEPNGPSALSVTGGKTLEVLAPTDRKLETDGNVFKGGLKLSTVFI